MWDDGERNMKLDGADFTEMDSLSRDPGFGTMARGVRKALTVWLVG